MSGRTFIQILILGGLVVLVLACITAAAIVTGPDWLPMLRTPTETSVAVKQNTPVATFTATATPSPSATLLPTPLPSATLLPVATATLTSTPTPLPSVTPMPSPTDIPGLTPTDLPASPQPSVDFIVVQQRMRSNEENSVLGKIVNNCGADHTIYVAIIDLAGNPVGDVLVGDTYDNVRAVSGSAGVGKLKIELWSNAMSLVVKQHINGELYSSEQTMPLSTRDEDIPAEWLFEGGYCSSIAECELRQQTNGLCRGHYSFDVTFQRTW